MCRLTYFPIKIFIKRLSFPNPIELAEAALKIPQIYCRLPKDNLAIPLCLISFHNQPLQVMKIHLTLYTVSFKHIPLGPVP